MTIPFSLQHSHFLLVTAVFLPLVAAITTRIFSKRPNLREGGSIIIGVLLFSIVLTLVQSPPIPSPVTLAEVLPGLSIALAFEPLGAIFALIASFLWIVTTVYGAGYMRGSQAKHQARFFACFAIAICCAMGIAFSANLFTLFIFYEMLSLSTFPLVTHSGTDEARRSGRVYIGILMGTSIGLLLPAMIWIWNLTGTLNFTPGGILQDVTPPWVIALLFAMCVYGVGKAALMPMHRWLPAAMVAPTPVSALLHAVAVVKAGVFTITKLVIYIFGLDTLTALTHQNWWFTGWLTCVAAATILLASIVALRQDNLKRRLAYSTISQLSYIILAASLLTPVSLGAAAMHIAAHAFGKITLFFGAGAIYIASKKTKVSQLNGIGHRMPVTMIAFSIGALSMIGIPPTVGFLSKWMLLDGALSVHSWLAVATIIGSTLLNAAYFLPIIYAAFFEKEADSYEDKAVKPRHGEAPWSMRIALIITAAGTILLFIRPELFQNLALSLPVFTSHEVYP